MARLLPRTLNLTSIGSAPAPGRPQLLSQSLRRSWKTGAVDFVEDGNLVSAGNVALTQGQAQLQVTSYGMGAEFIIGVDSSSYRNNEPWHLGSTGQDVHYLNAAATLQ